MQQKFSCEGQCQGVIALRQRVTLFQSVAKEKITPQPFPFAKKRHLLPLVDTISGY
jgi:hypothetical protein